MKKIIFFLLLAVLSNLSFAIKRAKAPKADRLTISDHINNLKSPNPKEKMSSFVRLYRLSLKEDNLVLMSDLEAIQALELFKQGPINSYIAYLAADLQRKILAVDS